MAIIKSFSPFQNLSNFSTFIVDNNPNSEFFRITEFKETFSGGKNGFLIEGSEFLKETTEVKIEILDVDGNPIYYEPGKGTPDYYEGLSTLVSVHIYPDTPIGIGKITILGELKQYIDSNGTLRDVPPEWQGVYNVKWERTFKINRNLFNEDIVRFYRRPSVSILELVKPIFSKTIPTVTQSGSVEGIAIQPSVGSNLSTWTAGTLYKLKITDDSNWTGSVDENVVNIPSLSYSPTVREVLNSKEVLVDIPYSIGGLVNNFSSTPYTTSFEFVEGQQVTDTALTGSFAIINISNLKTFVGDVARVKVFRKSRNEVTDFQFVQESKLESTELLRDITIANDTQVSYGNFSDFNLSTYWITSSNSHPVSVNVDILQSSVKTDYNIGSGGVQNLITSESFLITKDVEYTLNFKTLISGSLNGSEYIKAYLSSSDYQQTFLTVSGSDIYKTRQSLTQNIIANPISSSNAKLVFEISGSDWYISNVSLKNAQETSFSPDEFLLIQEIPRKLPVETFDFRFEFYDINNNYIPVDVTAVGTFDGGNDFTLGGTSAKILTFESDRNAFRFSTGSLGNPETQFVQFITSTTNLTGSILFASQAFDVNGNLLTDNDYIGGQYPGFLTQVTPAGALLTLANFTGSRNDITIGSIVYTASIEDLTEFETVYRLEDGDNAPQLIVTSNANQFIYEPTTLSPKPSGQSITIRAQRKNLASLSTAITVNKSNPNGPNLNVVSDVNGVKTYSVSALEFSASFAANNFNEITYQFTGSDIFGNQQTDEITLSKVINFDGVSLVLSNEATTFPAFSTGTVIGGFSASSGSVQMFIGGNQIQHDDISGGRQKNTFDITSIVGSGVTPTSTSPTNEFYSISGMSADSGSLTLNIEYLAGDSSTSQSFQKVVSYSKAKRAVPNVEVAVTPTAQSIQSNSRGSGSVTPQTLTVTALEGGTNRLTSLGTPTYTNGLAGSVSTNTIIFSSNASSMTSDSGTITIPVNFTDSEGTSGTKNIVATVSRVRSSAPIVNIFANPQSQTVISGSVQGIGIPSNVSIIVNEGGSNYTYDDSAPYSNSTFRVTSVTNATNNNNGTITPNTPTNSSGTTGVISISYVNSEGTSLSGTINFTVGVAGIGNTGTDGAPGDPGADGADGPGVVFRGPWSSTTTYYDTDDYPTRRDAVLYNGTYYATLPNATTNLNKQPDTQTAFWESLGTDSYFVAAEIAIFRESFVKETINVGTNSSGNANITIAGGTTSPYISIGQATKGYNQTGAWIGSDGTTGKLSLKSASNSLLWDGTNLTITGGGTFSGALSAASGTFTGALSGGTISIGSGNSIFKADSNGIYLGNATFASAPFRVALDGTLNATSANISGAITATSLTLSPGVTISNSQVSGLGALAVRNTVNNTYIDDNSITTGKVVANTLDASHISALNFTGKTATFTNGTIGGWTIEPDRLSSPPDGSGYSRLIFSPTPLIAVNNTSGQPKLTIKAGELSQLGAAGSVSLSFSGINFNSFSDSYFQIQNTIYGPSSSFNVPNSGTYSGTISCTSTGTLATTPSPWSGYLYVGMGIQVATDSGFSNVIAAEVIGSGGIGSAGSVSIVGQSRPVSIGFSSSGTHYVRVFWQRILYSSTTAPTTFYSNSSTIQNATLGQSVEATELTDKGFQVVNSTNVYLRIAREGNYDTTPFVQVGGTLSATQNIIAYYSDKRLKNIEGKIDNALDKIDKINGVYYTQNDVAKEFGYKNYKRQVGLIAQEVEEILPEVIQPAPFDISEKDGSSKTGENYLTIDYNKLVPLLVEGIKELKAEIEELKRNK